MESFMDEKIISMLNEAERAAEPGNITEQPVRIGRRRYEFAETSFFDEELSLYLPKDFADMPEPAARIKYPHENRPQVIKSDETGAIAFTLSPIDQELDDDSVQELTTGMKSIIRQMNPSHLFFDEGLEDVNGRKIGYFDFKSPVLDGFLYNLMYVFAFKGQTVMGTFGCPYADSADWRDIAMQVIRTVKDMPKKEGEPSR